MSIRSSSLEKLPTQCTTTTTTSSSSNLPSLTRNKSERTTKAQPLPFDGTPTLTEPLPVQQFSTTYASRLPLTAIVHSGEYEDRNLHVTIGVNDRIILQHLQNVRIVKLQGVLTKHNFTVPLSSNTYLSLLYTANTETVHGSVFKKVSQLMTAKPLPKVVCATKAWSNGNVSIRNPEILIPIERIQNGSVDGMLMFSMADRDEKFLPESCTGNFNTSPKMVSMLLQDAIAHVPRVFSSTAYIDDPLRTNNKYVMIMGLDHEVTIKCTTVDKQNGISHELDLPIATHDLRLCVIEWGNGIGKDGMGKAPGPPDTSPTSSSMSSDIPSADDPLEVSPLDPRSDDSPHSDLLQSADSVHSSESLTSSQESSLTLPSQLSKKTHPVQVPSPLLCAHASSTSGSLDALPIPTKGQSATSSLPSKEMTSTPSNRQDTQTRVATPSSTEDLSATARATPSSIEDLSATARVTQPSVPSQGVEPLESNDPASAAVQHVAPVDFSVVSPPISLLELVRQYQTSLPIHIKVESRCLTPPFEAEFLTARSVKYLEVVTGLTSEGSVELPLCTDLRFSILFDPTHDLKEAIKGFLFRGVPSLVNTSPRPAVVWVKEGWSSEEVSVEKDELLVPKRYKPEQQGLAVYSLWTRSEKILPMACTAVFSSNANHTMLHLCDLVSYVSNPFPCKACIVKHSGPKCSLSSVVTLQSKTVAPVLVCSVLTWDAASEGLPPPTYYVPLTLSWVSVVVIEPPKTAITGPSQARCTEVFPMTDADTQPECLMDSTDVEMPSNSDALLPTAMVIAEATARASSDVNESSVQSLDNMSVMPSPSDLEAEVSSGDDDEDRHLTVSL